MKQGLRNFRTAESGFYLLTNRPDRTANIFTFSADDDLLYRTAMKISGDYWRARRNSASRAASRPSSSIFSELIRVAQDEDPVTFDPIRGKRIVAFFKRGERPNIIPFSQYYTYEDWVATPNKRVLTNVLHVRDSDVEVIYGVADPVGTPRRVSSSPRSASSRSA